MSGLALRAGLPVGPDEDFTALWQWLSARMSAAMDAESGRCGRQSRVRAEKVRSCKSLPRVTSIPSVSAAPSTVKTPNRGNGASRRKHQETILFLIRKPAGISGKSWSPCKWRLLRDPRSCRNHQLRRFSFPRSTDRVRRPLSRCFLFLQRCKRIRTDRQATTRFALFQLPALAVQRRHGDFTVLISQYFMLLDFFLRPPCTGNRASPVARL